MIKRVGRRGDTLIEVALAIGIFSMVAIAITAVLSSGTAGAQAALESTLTREEVDTQAEALRFIHTAYSVNGNDTETNKFAKLWKDITSNAIDLGSDTTNKEFQTSVLQYNPTSCSNMYNGLEEYAFVINPRQLGSLNVSDDSDPDISSILIQYNSNKLQQASIYPHLVYNGNSNTLSRAEGIYVIAVRDNDTTTLATDDEKTDFTVDTKSAFYDFYIRSCWYGTDSEEPSTISTVIRLYDPDAIEAAEVGYLRVNYKISYPASITPSSIPSVYGRKVELPTLKRANYTFKGWCTGSVTVAADGSGTCNGTLYTAGQSPPSGKNGNTITYNLTDTWERIKYTVTYNTTGGTTLGQTICYQDSSNKCVLSSTKPTRSGFTFNKWCVVSPTSSATSCSSTSYASGGSVPLSAFPSSRKITLYATWNWHTQHTISYNTTGGSSVSKTTCYQNTASGGSCTITSTKPTRPGYTFSKWCATNPTNHATTCASTSYSSGSSVSFASFPSSKAITLYAVWTPHFIQDYSTATCRNEASSSAQTLVDKRDYSTYTVRYANGQCWMTQDLHVGSASSGKVTAANSNFSSPSTWNLQATTNENSYTQARSTLYSNVGYYNFCAATAGTGNGCTKDTQYTGRSDICPAHWRIPNGSEMAGVRTNSAVFPTSLTSGQWWTSTDNIGLGDGDVGRLMCALSVNNGGFYFSTTFNATACGQTYQDRKWGFRRSYTFRIRCVHE